MLTTTPRIVDCLLVIRDIDGSVTTVNCRGLKLDDEHVLYLTDEGIIIEKYIPVSDETVVLDKDSPFIVYLHTFNIGYPPDSISLEMLSELSAVDFMRYLATLYRRDSY